jgi:hypothetical protein
MRTIKSKGNLTPLLQRKEQNNRAEAAVQCKLETFPLLI